MRMLAPHGETPTSAVPGGRAACLRGRALGPEGDHERRAVRVRRAAGALPRGAHLRRAIGARRRRRVAAVGALPPDRARDAALATGADRRARVPLGAAHEARRPNGFPTGRRRCVWRRRPGWSSGWSGSGCCRMGGGRGWRRWRRPMGRPRVGRDSGGSHGAPRVQPPRASRTRRRRSRGAARADSNRSRRGTGRAEDVPRGGGDGRRGGAQAACGAVGAVGAVMHRPDVTPDVTPSIPVTTAHADEGCVARERLERCHGGCHGAPAESDSLSWGYGADPSADVTRSSRVTTPSRCARFAASAAPGAAATSRPSTATASTTAADPTLRTSAASSRRSSEPLASRSGGAVATGGARFGGDGARSGRAERRR